MLSRETLRKVQYEIAIIVVASIGFGALMAAFSEWRVLISLGITAAVMLVLVLLVVERARHEQRLSEVTKQGKDIEDELSEIQAKRSQEERDEAANLLLKTVEFSTEILRDASERLQVMVREMDTAFVDDMTRQIVVPPKALKTEIIDSVLDRLRLMFEGDTRGVDTTRYPHNYFKAALFEVMHTDSGIHLQRTNYDYPTGKVPHQDTEWVDVYRYPRAAHVLAYLTQEIIIIEDVPSESRKEANQARWMDLTHNQNVDYRSMVCVPIVSGKRGTSSRECLAVLVIDTNRDRYFRESDSQYGFFLGRILSPYRTLITLAFDGERILTQLWPVEESPE